MAPKQISVIIPVYNNAKLLPKCIDSVLSQSFSDFELILINDGSNDNTASICDSYSVKDNRIIVVHKNNEGVSAARNEGLKIAGGKYVCFCDSDDYVEPCWLQDLYEAAEKHPDSLIISNVDVQEVNRQYLRYNDIDCLIPISEFWFKREWGYPVNKIFLNQLIKEQHLQFDIHLKAHEDELFVGLYGANFNSAFIIGNVGYHYINSEPFGIKYHESLAWANQFHEYRKLKEINKKASQSIVERITMVFYDHVRSSSKRWKDEIPAFKDCVGSDIQYVLGKKKVLLRALRFSNKASVWCFIFNLYSVLNLI